MLLLKAFPLFLIAGLGGMIAFNREAKGNSEEVLMNEIGKGTKDVEKEWGGKIDQKTLNERKVSFWKQGKGDEGWKRNKEGRREIHSDIYIFDLCN